MNGCLAKRHGYFLDLDGTLVNTHASNLAAYTQAVYEVLPTATLNRDDLCRHIAAGESCTSFLPTLFPDITRSELQAIMHQKALCYPNHLALSTLNHGIVAAMQRWRRRPGTLIALVTTAKRMNAQSVIEHHGLGHLFDMMVFGDNVKQPKPAPEIYNRALRLSGLCPNEVEAFEDSEAGISAARAAGIAVTRVQVPANAAHGDQ